MKVVIVNEGLSYPPTAGNFTRTLNLMLQVAKRHEVTYVCRGTEDPEEVKTAREFYADHSIRAIITDDHPPRKDDLVFYGRLAANLLSPLPYSIASHNSPKVRAAVAHLAATEPIDLFQFETLAYADVPIGNAPSVIMAHNVESLIWQRRHEIEQSPMKKWYFGHQWRKFEKLEGGEVLRRATRVVAVSREDKALFESRFGLDRVRVIDNGVDVSFFDQAAKSRSADPKKILFLGSLDWHPNVDAINLLLRRIFPEVLRKEPQARLSLVGRNPSAELIRAARELPNVEVHANVPDVRPYLASSAMLAVPLRVGGGSRLKIVEAVAAGVPVVSTRVGAEGLVFENERDMVLVEETEHMAGALLECMANPARAEAMAGRAREIVDRLYDWSCLADRLEDIWRECVDVVPANAA